MSPRTPKRAVTLVSHGPNCLDGLTCAVVGARYFAGRDYEAVFASNRAIDSILRDYYPEEPAESELWITDISWTDEATSEHLNRLIDEGLEVYWVDHHRSAMDAREAGKLNVNFTDFVLSDTYAASRLLFDFLCAQCAEKGLSRPGLLAVRNLVMLADDVDRWVLDIQGSRRLALAVRAMSQENAYRCLLSMDSSLRYSRDMEDAAVRMEREVRATIGLAEATRHVTSVPGSQITVVAADCDGYAGEVAEHWQPRFERAVFALHDRRGDSVSFRRTVDCGVDLSRLAGRFGGGGHPAAAGCAMALTEKGRPQTLAGMVAEAIEQGG